MDENAEVCEHIANLCTVEGAILRIIHVISVRAAVSGLALVVLLASCAGLADHDGGGTDALLFERKQKTYDLELERVYDAVRAYIVSEGGSITAGSRNDLSLEAVVPGSAVSGS